MRSFLSSLLLGALAITSEGAPAALDNHLVSRQSNNTAQVRIPQKDAQSTARAQEVATRKRDFWYGPSKIGQAAPFPAGPLGDFRSKYDMNLWGVDRDMIEADLASDLVILNKSLIAHGGPLKTLDDYANVLYKGQWEKLDPRHPALGILTNYTQDLFFSMERLTQNPYSLKVVKPSDKLLFEVDDAEKIAGATLEELQKDGRLFVADHSYQANGYIPTNKYGAPASAYFYISDDKTFLPLAIKTNYGKNLTYTKLDTPTDWLLAKMIFNVADQFTAQIYHLTATHNVQEGVHEAAMRTLSDNHPVMAMLDRLAMQVYSARIVGEEMCFNPNGHWDDNFHLSGYACEKYVTDHWATDGAYQANYLETDFKARGLVDAEGKSVFKNFPFWDDATAILDIQRAFYTSFVDTYYPTDSDVAGDWELQAWFVEVSQGAKVPDFPQCGGDGQKKCDKATLTQVLTHNAWLQVAHHTLNSGDPIRSKLTLPFHPGGLYAEVPEAKGETNIVKYLPPAANATNFIAFLGTFNRPFYNETTNGTTPRTLAYAYSAPEFLERFTDAVKTAADKYLAAMSELGTQIAARKFGDDGLSIGQGMPFVWDALQPLYIPFFLSV